MYFPLLEDLKFNTDDWWSIWRSRDCFEYENEDLKVMWLFWIQKWIP